MSVPWIGDLRGESTKSDEDGVAILNRLEILPGEDGRMVMCEQIPSDRERSMRGAWLYFGKHLLHIVLFLRITYAALSHYRPRVMSYERTC